MRNGCRVIGACHQACDRDLVISFMGVWVIAGLLIIAGILGCQPQQPTIPDPKDGPTGRLLITGSTTMAPLMREIANRFEAQNPAVRVEIQVGGSAQGLADVRHGAADIGMVSRALSQDEADVVATQIAIDGVGMLVHTNNPVENLEKSQIVDLYQGRIDNWKSLGGGEGPIRLLHKKDGSATGQVFLGYLEIAHTSVRTDREVGHSLEVINEVAEDPQSIGYVSIGNAETEIQSGTPVRLLSLNGVSATNANVANGSFPVVRPLHLVTLPKTSTVATAFLEYCQSGAIDDLIGQRHFVPVSNRKPSD